MNYKLFFWINADLISVQPAQAIITVAATLKVPVCFLMLQN
jgi:hypothetical protein